MNDEQIEAALRRYQPTGPTPSLGSLVVDRRPARVVVEWMDWGLVAIAASLMVAVLWPTATKARDPLSVAYRARVDEVAEGLGGDAQARDLAVVVLAVPAPPAESEPLAMSVETRP